MAAIDKLVQITITKQTQQVTRRAFGWALVLGASRRFGGRLQWYSESSWSASMLGDGFLATDPEYLAVGSYFGQSPCPTQVAVGRIDIGQSINDALAACLQADPSWYGLVLCSKVVQDCKDGMAWTQANGRVYILSSWDVNIFNQTLSADTTSLAAYCKAGAYDRAAVLATRGSLYPEAAWFGRCLPQDPGTVDWAHKTLAGVTVDPLTDTQSKNAHDKYASTYETIGGLNKTEEGWTGSGDFLDARQAIDWLQATLQEEIYALLANTEKLPFTDTGIKSVEGVVRRVLKQATDNGVLADFDASQGDFVKLPRAADVSPSDRAARKLNAPKCFQRRLAGSLHHITVQGNLAV